MTELIACPSFTNAICPENDHANVSAVDGFLSLSKVIP